MLEAAYGLWNVRCIPLLLLLLLLVVVVVVVIVVVAVVVVILVGSPYLSVSFK
jgi:hypothetical protein